MATRDDLKELEKNCFEVKDYVELARKAFEEPADVEYAKELLESAQDECKFPDDYILVAEVYAKIKAKEKVEELLEEAEENAFEPLELGRIAHTYYQCLDNLERAKEIYQNALNQAKKLPEVVELLSFIQKDFPDSDLLKTASKKISGQIKNFNELSKIAKDVFEKDQNLSKQLLKEFEKTADGIENISALACLVFELFNDKDWAVDLLEDFTDEAKFTKEFVQLAKVYHKLGELDKVSELLSLAKDYAISGEENYDLALAIWELQKDSTATTELLLKSYKTIKDRNTLKNIVKFASTELEKPELAKEIINYLIENPSSTNELLENIKFGFELLQDNTLTTEQFQKSLEKLTDPLELVTFGTELHKITNDIANAKKFFYKAFEKTTKFEHFVEQAKKYVQIFQPDDFITKTLQKCEEIANSTIEKTETAKLYLELLNDTNIARKNLEIAEEIVASLEDMKLVVENVKKYFSDDENWIKRVEEKLAKRESNQSKYDEFLKIEKDAKYLKDLLNLIEKVFRELDDIYYGKKLFNKAKALIDNQYLNIENYYKLCKSIIEYTQDFNWAKSIFDYLYQNRIKFVNELDELLHFAILLFEDKEFKRAIIMDYLNGWKNKIKDKLQAIKFAKLLDKYNFPSNEIEEFLANYFKDDKEFSTLFPLLELTYKLNLDNLKYSVLKEIWGSIRNSNELIILIEMLAKNKFDRNILHKKYLEFAEKMQKSEDVIELIENNTKIFGGKNIDEIFKLGYEKSVKKKEVLDRIKSIILEQKYC
jgi:hypothetical protein